MKPSLASAPTVITCHSNADWDALSSMIGMSMIYPDSIMIFPGSMEKPLNQFFNETAVFLYTFKNIKEIDHASVRYGITTPPPTPAKRTRSSMPT